MSRFRWASEAERRSLGLADLGFKRIKVGERVRRRISKKVYVGRKMEEEGGAQEEHMVIDS